MKPSLKRELEKVFEAPAPKRKGEFLKKVPQTKISTIIFAAEISRNEDIIVTIRHL